jgi:hypothetical protein
VKNEITPITMDKFSKESSRINLKGKRIPNADEAAQAARLLVEISEKLQNLATLSKVHNLKMTKVAYKDRHGFTVNYSNVLSELQSFSPIVPFDKHGNRTHDNFGNKIQEKDVEINGKKFLLEFTNHFSYLSQYAS